MLQLCSIDINWGFLGTIKGQLGVPLTVYPWYLLCSLGFLEIITHKYQLYRAYIGIFHRGTLVGVHPCLSPETTQLSQATNPDELTASQKTEVTLAQPSGFQAGQAHPLFTSSASPIRKVLRFMEMRSLTSLGHWIHHLDQTFKCPNGWCSIGPILQKQVAAFKSHGPHLKFNSSPLKKFTFPKGKKQSPKTIIFSGVNQTRCSTSGV